MPNDDDGAAAVAKQPMPLSKKNRRIGSCCCNSWNQ